jgi:hypothetical protein
VNTDRLKEYARLRRVEKELGTEASAIKEQADTLEQELLEEFAESGLQKMTVDGSTIYLRRDLWASRINGATALDVCEAFEKAGLTQFVTTNYNSNTVSAWLREIDASGEQMPESVAQVLGAAEKFSLRVLKG